MAVHFQLANGMHVLVAENHDVAVATADVWVRTGSADEPPALSGVSHFLEHMLFKGTEKYGLGEIEKRIERCGGQSNAGTSYDFTHYYVTLPSAGTETAIEMLGEMVQHSVVEPEELEKERLVILEEWRRKQDVPTGILFERLYAEMFTAGRYHDPVIGYEETIRAITREGMVDYYRRRYAAENMVLVVTGDVQPEAVRAAAEKTFSGFARKLEVLRPTPAAKLGKARIHEHKPTGGEMYVAWAWGAPGFTGAGSNGTARALGAAGQPVPAATILALDVAQFILGQGRAARLFQSLKEKAGLCSSITAFYPTHAAESMFGVFASCLPAQHEALRSGLATELATWLKGPLKKEELERAKRLLVSAHRFGMETSSGVAGQLGYYWTLTGGMEFLDNYERGILALTTEEILAAARGVFGGATPDEIAGAAVEVAVGPK